MNSNDKKLIEVLIELETIRDFGYANPGRGYSCAVMIDKVLSSMKEDSVDNLKWLKRKMPMSFELFIDFVDYKNLKHYKFGVLNNSISLPNRKEDISYPKGTPILFERLNSINNENHPFVYVLAKCKEGITASGFQTFTVGNKDICEIFR